MRLAWIGIGILVVVATALVLGDLAGLVPATMGSDVARLAALVALLVVIGGSVLASRDFEWSKALKAVAMWGGLLALLVMLYAFFGDTFEQARF